MGGIIAKPYVGNKKTGVVHDMRTKGDQCRVSEIKPENRVYFGTISEVFKPFKRSNIFGPKKKKYRSCKRCII